MKISWSLSGFIKGAVPVGIPIDSSFIDSLIGYSIYADHYKTVGRITEVDLENNRIYGEIVDKEYERQILDAKGFNCCEFEIVRGE